MIYINGDFVMAPPLILLHLLNDIHKDVIVG